MSSGTAVTDPWAPVAATAESAFRQALLAAGIATEPGVLTDLLQLDGAEGRDAAFPVHRWAKGAGKSAAELATDLAARVPLAPPLAAVRADSGFVDFEIDRAWLIQTTLAMVLSRKDRYGRGDQPLPETCVEHTSANPTGPLHVGRSRNALLGDAYARILRGAGARTTVQYYVDDLGRQAAMMTWIAQTPYADWPEELRRELPDPQADPSIPDHVRWGRVYPLVSAYLKDHPEDAEKVAELTQRLESGEPVDGHRALAESILKGILQPLVALGIHYDEFVWESEFLRDGSVERVVERLKRAPHAIREPNGAWAIEASSHGLPKESAHVIFLRGNGTSLYPTRDVAYHLQKFARFPSSVDVLGQDHILHCQSLDALLAEIGETRRSRYLFYQYLTLPGKGKMSTRGGSGVWIDDLLAEAIRRARAEVTQRRPELPEAQLDAIAKSVATGAIRYNILRIAPEKTIEFRWEEALSFEGRSGPFLQYSYARAASILRRAESKDYSYDPSQLLGVEEFALIRILARLPRLVQYAARTGHVQSIAGFAHDLADQFNRFYHAVPVLAGGDSRTTRLALVAAVHQTLGNALELLGIDRLETM